jgi:multiple sugar transport system substrate-binding protein
MKRWLFVFVGVLLLIGALGGVNATLAAEQPFKGITINVITGSSNDPNSPITGPFYTWKEEWEQRTGAKLNIIGIPSNERHQKLIIDLQTGAGQYDGWITAAWWYGDFVPQGWIIPIDQFYNDPRFPQWEKDALPAVEALHKWEGKWYGALNDSDGQVLYYRRDILTNPKWQAEFKSKYGYDLPVPPKTWDQMYDISSFFNGKDWDGDGEADSGISLHLKVGGQGMFHFMSLAAPFVVLAGDKVDKAHNLFWFDPETMEPMINEPGHVKALEFLIKLAKTGPEAQNAWSLGEAWDYFLRGKAIFTFSWGDVGALAQDTKRSKITGKVGAAHLPGNMEVYDRAQKKFIKLNEPNIVGNTTGGTWHGVISKLSKHPEVVYDLFAFHATKKVALWNAIHGWTGVDPGRKSQMLPPYGTATLEDYTKEGWDANDVKDYLMAYGENYSNKKMLPFLRIPGTFEYWKSLDTHLSEAMIGQLTPQKALDRTAQDWREITDRLGKEDQLQVYQTSIGYKK